MYLNLLIMDKIVFCDKEMIIEDGRKTIFLTYYQIVDITTSRPYIVVTLLNNDKFFIDSSLSQLYAHLPVVFFKCNRSSIINLLHVKLYLKEKRHFKVHTALQKQFCISPQYSDEFKKKLYFIKTHSFFSEDCLSCNKQQGNKNINI